jgi:hypothetical protein
MVVVAGGAVVNVEARPNVVFHNGAPFNAEGYREADEALRGRRGHISPGAPLSLPLAPEMVLADDQETLRLRSTS